MENMRKELETLKAGFKDLEEKKGLFFRDFGSYLLKDDIREGIGEIEVLVDGYRRIETIGDERRHLEDKVNEIHGVLDSKKELEDKRKEARDSIRELEKANTSLYENMGRAGYLAFQEGLLTGEEFGSVFRTLEEEKERINTFEVELKKSGSGSEGFFKKLMNRSREVYLKSNQNMRIRNLVKVYQKAGEALGGMEGIPWEENESLGHAFLPYFKNREKQGELGRRDEELAASEQTLRERMEVLGIHRNSGKKLSELEEEILFQDDKLEQEKFYLGKSWWELDKKLQKSVSVPVELKQRKESLDKDFARLEADQDILERKIRRKELSETLVVQERERQRLENRLNQAANDLDRKKSEIGDIEKELESLRDLDADE